MKKRKILLFPMAIIIIFIVFKVGNMIMISKTKTIIIEDKKEGKVLTISITKGEEYLHKFKVNSLISIKTPPQFAIWVEDINGNYIETLYATSKISRQNWSKAPNDSTSKDQIKRDEALPYWTHKKNHIYINPDEISSATPKGDSIIKAKTNVKENKFVILAEFNNSTDFNEHYPKGAKPGDDNYSGGEWGSGQPAIIYAATIDLNLKNRTYDLKPIGHSSSDGTNGDLYSNLSKLTTAKNIVKSINLEIK